MRPNALLSWMDETAGFERATGRLRVLRAAAPRLLIVVLSLLGAACGRWWARARYGSWHVVPVVCGGRIG